MSTFAIVKSRSVLMEEGLLCGNDIDDTLPSCSSFSCDGENYLEEDFTLASSEDSAEEDELTLPSAADTLDFEDDRTFFSEDNTELVPKVPAGPLLTSTPQKFRHGDCALHSSNSVSQSYLVDEEHLWSEANEIQWRLTDVIRYNGCGDICAIRIHELTSHDVLNAHCYFENKTQREQNDWLIQYFSVHCPHKGNREKDFKNVPFIIQGKLVCMKLWLVVLSLSTSRFYRLRQDFLQFGGITSVAKRRRSLSAKTLEAITWMEQYFQRVGDKRPDKADSIYLPTCLTETKLFEIFIEDVYNGDSSHSISRSQFNNLFRKDFKHVTIPKVRVLIHAVLLFV